jgi:fatty-acyl-CoA synthase
LPWDGKTFGRLKVRGPAIAKAYFKETGNVLDQDGFFDTGDVATVDQYGYMQITDRAKDVIKSGGEWISSIDLENLAVGHPKVAEAAVIGVRHPKWDERPLLVVVLKKGQTATKDDILGFMEGKIAKWWLPDDVAFVDEIPHTATGKILKTALRETFREYALPPATMRG